MNQHTALIIFLITVAIFIITVMIWIVEDHWIRAKDAASRLEKYIRIYKNGNSSFMLKIILKILNRIAKY